MEPVNPPVGESDFFGPGPHFRFYHHNGLDEVVLKGGLIQNVGPNAITDEDKMRNFLPVAHYPTPGSVSAVIDYLYRVVATEGPFEGIMGLSEGSNVAATFLAEDIRRCELDGKKSMFKAAVFFCGSPPLSGDGKSLLLADVLDRPALRLHTYHVIGSNDPMLHASMALLNVCDPDKTLLFDHGKGHQISWEPRTAKRISLDIRELIELTKEDFP